jgi:epoxyqueuosine reductase
MPHLTDSIRDQAAALGFEACGVAAVEAAWPAAARLEQFVADGLHGEMAWMATTVQRRAHPRGMWPDARSAIVLGMSYAPDRDPLEALDARSNAAISVYAQGDDYHEVIKKRL